ncbi:GNAT family N-acetyltransferase [Tissierella carlieri]|uniref:GNAT family N-acetyltransferase n=1 Tax=Tissierella carlieri TaxID=689904 RepID=A0ABT1SFN8_9FIRM|nr:GNAT family N-acetyltransferase [Tissierella carlieri]MCQ4925177.1 GNAT family N-acetyltransferase [Tissierella carlieri]
MKFRFQYDCSNIEWENVVEILKAVGMANYDRDIHKKAFENSYRVVFVFDEEKLIGFGRTISDGVYQAAIYDIVVSPEYQGKSIGRIIMNKILEGVPNCNCILYASPGKESFYEKFNFKRMKTGMALFNNAHKMKEKGFIE